jgi:ribonuclease-3
MVQKLPPINNQNLLKQALTHSSYANEISNQEDNERLEFLGDAVLGFLVAQMLYKQYPELNEAQLTRIRSMLVDQKQLANLAKELNLGSLLHLGKGAQKDEVRNSSAVLSDTFEAIIGAYFLDAGIIAVQDYLEPIFRKKATEIMLLNQGKNDNLVNAKNRLQEWAIVNLGENPVYNVLKEVGPPHAKTFVVEVKIKNKVYGVGEGLRKQEAEKQAAIEALENLDIKET